MHKMKILFTGGSGFIGRNIIESFIGDKYDILSPKHAELELMNEESVCEYFMKNEIEIVVHAAGKPGHRNAKDLSNIYYSDMRMFLNIIRNRQKFRKMIILGSGAIYDMRNYKPKVKEEDFDKFVPSDEHGFFRYTVGKYIEGLDGIIDLRIFGIFGKYEDYAIRFISNAICKTLYDLPITVKQNRRFDYICVNDFIRILDHFIENEVQYSAYNISPDQSIELSVLAEKVRMISGKDLPILVFQNGMGLEYSGDNSRLRREIPGLEFTPVDDAIEELYGWYSENKDKVNREFLLFDK